MDGNNRAYVLTARGAAAIAVVRLTGPGVGRFLETHFSKPVMRGRCIHGELKRGDSVLDDPVVVVLPNGAADVSLHGGPWVVQSVLELAQQEGFELTEGDESPETADGANMLEKEVNACLPRAQTDLGVRVLLQQVAAWEQFVRRATPGPGEETHLARWMQKAEQLRAEIVAILADKGLWWLLNPPRVAIIGAPNVGKSTLANQLFARERVITADLPGTTRDWVGETANLDGLAVMLVDTPGIRDTQDAIEAEAIARSGEQIKAADLVIVVLDASGAMEGEQAAVLEAWPDALRVVNKVDCAAPAWDMALIGGVRTVGTTGQGVDELRKTIRARFGIVAGMDEHWPRWWTPRQRQVLEEAGGRVELVRRMIDG